MRLVVDANVVVAALFKNATTRQILLVSDLGFFAPQHLRTARTSIYEIWLTNTDPARNCQQLVS